MKFDFIDAGKAALLGVACIGGVICLTELLAWLENKYNNRGNNKGGGL